MSYLCVLTIFIYHTMIINMRRIEYYELWNTQEKAICWGVRPIATQ